MQDKDKNTEIPQCVQPAVMQSVMFNELRIGNYIQFSSGSVYPVDIIYKDYTMLKNWFAIPLSTEWLLMLRFEKIGANFRKYDVYDKEKLSDFIINCFKIQNIDFYGRTSQNIT